MFASVVMSVGVVWSGAVWCLRFYMCVYGPLFLWSVCCGLCRGLCFGLFGVCFWYCLGMVLRGWCDLGCVLAPFGA